MSNVPVSVSVSLSSDIKTEQIYKESKCFYYSNRIIGCYDKTNNECYMTFIGTSGNEINLYFCSFDCLDYYKKGRSWESLSKKVTFSN